MMARLTILALIAATISLAACGSEPEPLTVAEYAQTVCGDGLLSESGEGEPETNQDVLNALDELRDQFEEIDPPDGLNAFHRMKIRQIVLIERALEEEGPDDPFIPFTLLSAALIAEADQVSVVKTMDPEIFAEMNEHGCDLSTESAFADDSE